MHVIHLYEQFFLIVGNSVIAIADKTICSENPRTWRYTTELKLLPSNGNVKRDSTRHRYSRFSLSLKKNTLQRCHLTLSFSTLETSIWISSEIKNFNRRLNKNQMRKGIVWRGSIVTWRLIRGLICLYVGNHDRWNFHRETLKPARIFHRLTDLRRLE